MRFLKNINSKNCQIIIFCSTGHFNGFAADLTNTKKRLKGLKAIVGSLTLHAIFYISLYSPSVIFLIPIQFSILGSFSPLYS